MSRLLIDPRLLENVLKGKLDDSSAKSTESAPDTACGVGTADPFPLHRQVVVVVVSTAYRSSLIVLTPRGDTMRTRRIRVQKLLSQDRVFCQDRLNHDLQLLLALVRLHVRFTITWIACGRYENFGDSNLTTAECLSST